LKIRNHIHRGNHFDHSPDCGFTLVELLVVVAIVAVLSVSSVIGFGYLGNTLKAREAAGFVSDLVKQEELKVLRGDFAKAVIHFLPDYLVIEEWPPDATDYLNLGSTTCNNVPPDKHIEYKIEFSKAGNLTKKNGDGDVLEVKPVDAINSPICVPFKTASDTEWSYQLTSGDQSSAILRFVHFNLQRDNTQNSLKLLSGYGSKAVINAPYGRKRLIDEKGFTKDSLLITVGNGDEGVSEQVTIQ